MLDLSASQIAGVFVVQSYRRNEHYTLPFLSFPNLHLEEEGQRPLLLEATARR